MASAGTAIGRAPKPRNPTEIDDDIDGSVAGPYHLANMPEHFLTFDRAQNIAVKEIADTHRLRKAHGGGGGQAHSRWRRHPARCPALRVGRARKYD